MNESNAAACTHNDHDSTARPVIVAVCCAQTYGCFNRSVVDSPAFLYYGQYSLWSCPTDVSQGKIQVRRERWLSSRRH